jgi:methylthioribulose-1-phosphate dehydratase
VAPDDLITVDGDGQLLDGIGKPSAETLLHLAIVKSRGAGAVLHTHSQAATLLSKMACPSAESAGWIHVSGLEMLKGLEGIKSHEEEVKIPVLANDQDLKRLSAAAQPLLQAAPHGLLIAGHGLYAWGANLEVAKRHLEILEFLLEHLWREQLLMARIQP